MRYAFGDFELDTDALELRCAGERRHVQPKVFQLLCYLVEQRERVVSKDELLRSLWPDEHVTESSLFVAVRAVRGVLDQAHGRDRPIVTLRGVGYRFAAEVQVRPSTAAASRAEPARRPLAPSQKARASPWDALVGRAQVMHVLSEALERAREGRGRLLLISGEPGIGKTRCAEALADLAEERGVRVLPARCLEGDGTPPFWPWIQLLRRIADEPQAAWAVDVRGVLAALVPDAQQPSAAESVRTAFSTDRFWLLDRVVHVLKRVLEAGPCVLVLDDLQWADPSSLRLLQLLSGELEQSPCVVVCTLREPRPGADPEHERMLQGLSRNATVLELSGLSEAETRELVSAVAGAGDAQLAADLHRDTAGNPFFLRELLRLALADPEHRVRRTGQLPRVVRDLVLGRLQALGPLAHQVLRAASVLGSELDLALLRQVAELPADDLFAGLDGVLDAQLLRQGASADHYAFTHDLVREAIHDELSQAERVRFHKRAGLALEARGGDGWQGEAAHHFHHALADGVHEKALAVAGAAGRAGLRVMAFDSAARYLRWALAALDHHPEDIPRTRAALTLELGTAVLGQGRSGEARQLLRAAAELADRHGYGDLLAATATWLRHNIATAPLPDPFSLRVLQRALQLLRHVEYEHEPELRVHVLSRLAWIYPNCEDMPTCKRLAGEALALARSLRSDAALHSALAAQQYALTGPDDIEALLAASAEVLALERKASALSWSSAQACFMRYHAHLHAHRPAEANAALEDFGAIVRELKLAEPTLLYDRLCAQRSFYEGRFAEAETAFVEQHARGKRLGLVYADLYFGIQMLSLLWERAGLRELQLSAPGDNWNIPSAPAYRAVRLFVATGHGDGGLEARAEWEALSAQGFAAIPRDLNFLNAMTSLAQVAIALADAPRARELYALLVPYAGLNTPTLLSHVSGAVAHYLGLLARFLGRDDEALGHLEHALRLHEQMAYVPWAARARLAIAELLLARESPEEHARARALLHDVADAAVRLGAEPLRARAEALL